MRRFLVLSAVAFVATAVAAPGAQAQADGAAVITDTGWWSANPGQPEPEGGFRVAQNPQGETTSVAALKLRVNVKTFQSALFVFREGPTRLSEASADVRLCRGLSNDWSGDNANPGALANAPRWDCARSVQLQRDATLQSWSGDAANLITGPGTFTLMLVPGDRKNGSIPAPTYDNLPRLQPPVALPTAIPPPLPVDPGSPDPLGFVFSTANCPPELYTITSRLGRPQQCLGLPRLVPPTPLPGLPLPPTLDLPFSIGFQVQMTGTELSAFASEVDSSFSGFDGLTASGGVSDSGVFATDSLGLGAAGGLPLTEAGAAAVLGAGNLPPTGTGLVSSLGGRPWGRIWLLGVVAALIGAGFVWARRQGLAMS